MYKTKHKLQQNINGINRTKSLCVSSDSHSMPTTLTTHSDTVMYTHKIEECYWLSIPNTDILQSVKQTVMLTRTLPARPRPRPNITGSRRAWRTSMPVGSDAQLAARDLYTVTDQRLSGLWLQHDYKSLRVAVMIRATMVNTHRHTHIQRQTARELYF